jgi:hypothetical protein
MSSALIGKSLRGGLVVVGGLNLGGSIDLLPNAIDVVELAVERGASVARLRHDPLETSFHCSASSLVLKTFVTETVCV